jgi:hypothetical protein
MPGNCKLKLDKELFYEMLKRRSKHDATKEPVSNIQDVNTRIENDVVP